MNGINTNTSEYAPFKDRLQALKECFEKSKDYDFSKSGQRIELMETDDLYTNLKLGSKGTIELIHKHSAMENQIWVRWDNGSTLMLLEGKDRYVEIEDESK